MKKTILALTLTLALCLAAVPVFAAGETSPPAPTRDDEPVTIPAPDTDNTVTTPPVDDRMPEKEQPAKPAQ
ncbi:MAG: hypothetical protein LBP55_06295 [Candidatus Adiutrix sp.]|jgi:hypothetical protein|nr:hypothetical protein [Candidatus Adiutrix sp.]